MKALVLKEISDPPQVSIEEIAQPVPQAGEVCVRIVAAGLNHRELWIAKGQYPGMALPATLGADGAGVVEAVGPDVDPALMGREVVLFPGLEWGEDPRFPAADFGLLGMPGPGTIARSLCVRADRIFPRPAHLGFEEAAALPLAGLTAWRGLTTKAELNRGERLLITGIGGGVATQALAFAHAMGVETWVTSGSDDTLAWAKEQGAAGGVNYHSETWGKELAKLAGPIDVVFDGAPAASYGHYGRALAMGARVVIYGSSGGMTVPVNAAELFLKNVRVIGTNVGNLSEFSAMLDFVTAHRLVPLIEKVFPFDQAPAALDFLENAHQRGKVVVRVNDNSGGA